MEETGFVKFSPEGLFCFLRAQSAPSPTSILNPCQGVWKARAALAGDFIPVGPDRDCLSVVTVSQDRNKTEI